MLAPMVAPKTLEEYVVSARKQLTYSIGTLVRAYGANVLDELNARTALVEMPRDIAVRLEQDHPELVIEENLPYKHLS